MNKRGSSGKETNPDKDFFGILIKQLVDFSKRTVGEIDFGILIKPLVDFSKRSLREVDLGEIPLASSSKEYIFDITTSLRKTFFS